MKFVLLALLALVVGMTWGRLGILEADPNPGEKVPESSAIATLYCADRDTSKFDFCKGTQSKISSSARPSFDLELVNTDSLLTHRVEGGIAQIVDLGSAAAMATRYGIVGGAPDGFAMIQMHEGAIVLKPSGPGTKSLEIVEARPILKEEAGLQRLEIRHGHLYVLRTRSIQGLTKLVKFMVLEYVRGQSVTFRWKAL